MKALIAALVTGCLLIPAAFAGVPQDLAARVLGIEEVQAGQEDRIADLEGEVRALKRRVVCIEQRLANKRPPVFCSRPWIGGGSGR